MIAMTLVALVATAAIPRMLEFRRKAMRAEPMPNLRSIGVAERAWFAAEGSWIAAAPNPELPVDNQPRQFDRQRADWKPLGWYPEKEVRCSYRTVVLDAGARVRADAFCDLDHDQKLAIIRYEVPSDDTTGSFLDLYAERY